MQNLTGSVLFLMFAIAPALSSADTWTGFYAGGQIGRTDTELTYFGRTMTEESDTYGLLAGYNRIIGHGVMLGAELNVDRLNYTQMPFEHDLMARRIKARLGYVLGSVLLYGTYGYSEIGDGTGNNEDGTAVSLGLDYRVNDVLSIGAEWLRDSYDFKGLDMEISSLRMRLAFQF